MFGEHLNHTKFLVAKARKFTVEIGMNGHGTLAGQLQTSRQGYRHHIAGIAHVIVGQPIPEVHLALGDDRFDVQNGSDVFRFPIRRMLMYAANQGGIQLLAAELHHHPLSGLYFPVVFLWNPICVCPR